MFLRLKTSISSFFTLLILINVLGSFLVISTFYSNQAYFVQNFCINKAQPTLCCKAKCHLNKLLLAAEQEQSGAESIKLSPLSVEYLAVQTLVVQAQNIFFEVKEAYPSFDETFFDNVVPKPSPPPKA